MFFVRVFNNNYTQSFGRLVKWRRLTREDCTKHPYLLLPFLFGRLVLPNLPAVTPLIRRKTTLRKLPPKIRTQKQKLIPNQVPYTIFPQIRPPNRRITLRKSIHRCSCDELRSSEVTRSIMAVGASHRLISESVSGMFMSITITCYLEIKNRVNSCAQVLL